MAVLHITGITMEGALYHTVRRADGSWQGFASVINEPMATANCTSAGQWLHYVPVGRNGTLYYTTRQIDQSWATTFGDTGIREIATASCAGVGESLHVVALSRNTGIYHTIRFGDGTWQPGVGDTGIHNMAGVACAPIGDTLHLVLIDRNGTLFHTLRNGDGSWQQGLGNVQQAAANGPASFAPHASAVACTAIGQDLHIVAQTADSKLYHTIRFGNGSWQGFGDVSLHAVSPGALNGVACAGVDGELQIVSIAAVPFGSIVHTIRRADGTWQPFGNVDTQAGKPGNFVAVGAC